MTTSVFDLPAPGNNYQQEHIEIVLKNLYRWTNYDLIQAYEFSLATLGEQVFKADFYLLSHNHLADPVLTYGNQRVLAQWEISWAELVAMPSRDTAKSIDRSARALLMAQVKAHNYVSGYSGLRVSKTGQEFQILDGIIWNLFRDNGDFYGQAAWFKAVSTSANLSTELS